MTLTFSENVGNGFVAVTAPSGRTVKTSDVRTLDHVLSADVAPSDERGRYTVAYRIVSADGHPIAGEITFTTTTGRVVEHVHAATRTRSSIVTATTSCSGWRLPCWRSD